jgi:malonyl-CoA O-methyltransferase
MRRLARLLQRLGRATTPPTLSSLDAYALWAEQYPPHAHNALMQLEEATMRDLMPPLAGRDVLDLACGTGRYGRLALERGARQVIGVDNSLPMLRNGVLTQAAQGTMARLPFAAGSFDVVLCGLALGHLPRQQAITCIAEVARVLRVGGDFLFSDFHPYLALSGGRRTFSAANGRQYAVEHFIYFPSEYFTWIGNSLMIMEGFAEPRIAPPALSPAHGREIPAVVVMRARK